MSDRLRLHDNTGTLMAIVGSFENICQNKGSSPLWTVVGNPVRLSPEQIVQIRQSVAQSLGPETRVWLFGSRVEATMTAGCWNDLLFLAAALSASAALRSKIRMLGLLESRLGEGQELTGSGNEY